jgi:hypothetical protein
METPSQPNFYEPLKKLPLAPTSIFSEGAPTKIFCMHFFFLLCVLHVAPIHRHLANSTNYEAHRFVISPPPPHSPVISTLLAQHSGKGFFVVFSNTTNLMSGCPSITPGSLPSKSVQIHHSLSIPCSTLYCLATYKTVK